jgi:hypothetical protein
MRTFLSWLGFALFLGSLQSCGELTGSGNMVSERRNVEAFQAIDAGGIAEVIFQQGSVLSVEVTADDNIIEWVETRVKGGTLHVKVKKNKSYIDATVRVTVTAPMLRGVDCSGASSFRSNGVWQSTEPVRIEASGASAVEAELDTPEVVVRASGGGEVQLRGKTRLTDFDAAGRASIRAMDLFAEEAKLDASGAGSIHAYASVRLKAKASGAAGIRYAGGGAVQSTISGAGSVSPK